MGSLFSFKQTTRIYKALYINVFSLFFCVAHAQQIDVDYVRGRKSESAVRVRLLDQVVIGGDVLAHLDVTSNFLKIKINAGKGFSTALNVLGTKNIIAGSKTDRLNNLSYLLNPVGGLVNASLFSKVLLHSKETSFYELGIHFGMRWVKTAPLPHKAKSNFIDNYGRLGVIYQRLLFEDAKKNQSLYLWCFPNGFVHHSPESKRKEFFDSQLKATAFGLGLELGLELNSSYRIMLIASQIVNAPKPSDLDRFYLRLSLGYRFKF